MTEIFRLKVDPIQPDWDKDPPKRGDLVFSNRRHNGHPLLYSSARCYGVKLNVEPGDYERSDPITHKDFPRLLDYYLNGGSVLPNVEAVNPEEALQSISCGGGLVCWPDVCHVLLPGEQRTIWARAFLPTMQFGGYDGSATLILYKRGWGPNTEEFQRFVRFRICTHEPVEGAGARHERGWHPAHCPKCGLNMSVDSGD